MGIREKEWGLEKRKRENKEERIGWSRRSRERRR